MDQPPRESGRAAVRLSFLSSPTRAGRLCSKGGTTVGLAQRRQGSARPRGEEEPAGDERWHTQEETAATSETATLLNWKCQPQGEGMCRATWKPPWDQPASRAASGRGRCSVSLASASPPPPGLSQLISGMTFQTIRRN